MENKIEITGVDLKALVKAVYANSKPVGLGMLHFVPGDLPDEVADDILSRGRPNFPVSMDYVSGRQCKFHVKAIDDKLYIGAYWYDHGQDQLRDVLTAVGIDASVVPD